MATPSIEGILMRSLVEGGSLKSILKNINILRRTGSKGNLSNMRNMRQVKLGSTGGGG